MVKSSIILYPYYSIPIPISIIILYPIPILRNGHQFNNRDEETNYKDAHHGITHMRMLRTRDGMVRKRSENPAVSRFSVTHPNSEIEDGWASQFGDWMFA